MDDIRREGESDRPLTIVDIARMAETSPTTVSNFLNGKLARMSMATRERVARVVRETGYVPSVRAKELARRDTHVIAVLLLDATNAWAGQVLAGIEREASAAGYQTVVCATHYDPNVERSILDKMLSFGVDGFVVQPTSRHRSVGRRLVETNKPYVFLDFGHADMGCTWVRSGLYDGVYDAVSACVESGYERCVIAAAEPGGVRSRIERMSGALDALDEHGVEAVTVLLAERGQSTDELERTLAEAIDRDRRTLVFCPHQWGLMRVIRAMAPFADLIPERVGVLGLNNTEWSDIVRPGISTLVEPVEQEGALACRLLLDQLQGRAVTHEQHVLPCAMRWLGSTR